MSNEVIFFNASVINNTGNIAIATNEEQINQDATFVNTFSAPILQKGTDYELSICRLVIPSDCIDIMNINTTNQADYQIGLSVVTNLVGGSDSTKNRYVNSIPLSIGSVSTIKGVQPYMYYSIDVLEGVNRTMTKSYYQAMSAIANQSNVLNNFGYYSNSASLNLTNLSETGNANTYTLPATYNFRVCSVKLTITNMVMNTNFNMPFSLMLSNANNEVLVFSTSPSEKEYSYLASNTGVTFAEYGINPFVKIQDMPISSSNVVYPMESFLKFSNNGSGNTWNISVIPTSGLITNNFSIAFNYTLEVIEMPDLPSLPPVFNLNTTGYLKLLYQQNYPFKNIKIELTPKLHRMLCLSSQSRRFLSDVDRFELIYPSLPLTHPMINLQSGGYLGTTTNGYNIITFQQFEKTSYRLVNIDKILVSANQLGVTSEFYNDYYQQQVIQDFVINKDSDLSELVYSTDASVKPYRRYRLNNETPVQNIGFQIFTQYIDGSVLKVQIPAGTTFSMKVGFFKI